MKEQLILKVKILELQRRATVEKMHRLKDQVIYIDTKINRLSEEINKLDQSSVHAPTERNDVAPRSNNF